MTISNKRKRASKAKWYRDIDDTRWVNYILFNGTQVSLKHYQSFDNPYKINNDNK